MPRSTFGTREPKTKADFISRMMSFDFNGDIRSLFPAGCVLTRTGTNSIAITSLSTSKKWVLKVSLPRKEEVQAVQEQPGHVVPAKAPTHQPHAGMQSGRERSSIPSNKPKAKKNSRK